PRLALSPYTTLFRSDDDAPHPPGRPAVERPATTADAVVLVAAGVGVAVVPQSLARLHHRKDVTYRRLEGAPSCPVALAWVAERRSEEHTSELQSREK